MISLQAPLNMTTQHLPTPSHGTASDDVLGYLLIFLSSVLVGIWAVKGTIALRNILLGVETVIAIIYCTRFFKTNTQKIPLKYWTPLILLGLMFCWVIFHYLFLSRFPEQQFHELISTWLRSGLAVIVAIGTGPAIAKRPNTINCLWIGILGSFGYLFYQYIPNALALKSLFVPLLDSISYIFYGKISAVLAGTILVAGLLGGVIDVTSRYNGRSSDEPKGATSFWKILMIATLWLIGTVIILYAYVFIFDTRNGIGLGVLIYGLGLLILSWRLFRALFLKGGIKKAFGFLLLIACSVGILGWFGMEQVKRNPGWSTMIEDSKTSVQIEKYPNWQNPQVKGYPQNAKGEEVKGNTYERLAWASAGVQIFLPENPLGIGVLKNPFATLLMQKYPNAGAYIPSSHSAWVEIALAFGYPGIFLLLASLLSITFLSLRSNSPFWATAGLLSLGLVMLYTVGEISSQHSVEILCFWVALMMALQWPRKLEIHTV